LKIIFAGTPNFAEIALDALIHSSHQVIAVFTQPDKPKGRGLKLTPSPVKALATMYQLPIYQPTSLKGTDEQELIANFEADVMVVAAYGLLLPVSVLSLPRFGCINIHPSLLPRFRGAAPIQRAIFAGDEVSGVTIMQMDAGLDTGPILLKQTYNLGPFETSQTLHDKLARIGASLLLETLKLLELGKIKPVPQDNDLATYANKIVKEEALLDWERPASELSREIRAFNPWPVAYTSFQGQTLRIWQALALDEEHNSPPRTILRFTKEGADIATGKGVLRLLELQLPGGKVLSASDFYNAKHNILRVGEQLI
jgi:methionyl-tRNA formyltransferase